MAWSNASYNTWYSTSDYSDVLVDDRHRCRVEGCRRKQVSTRSPDGRKNYSNHCFNHNCSRTYHDDSLGVFHCTTSKDEGERYCPDRETLSLSYRRRRMARRARVHPLVLPRPPLPPPLLPFQSHGPNPTTLHHALYQMLRLYLPRPCHQHRDGRLDIVCAVHYGRRSTSLDGGGGVGVDIEFDFAGLRERFEFGVLGY
ncbi:hypothetical protein N0V88_006796 [Collariella sp. IMI 366227]|nr:hypothetical protein N0V88_006796 [Collariella sp. IMI 366227]